MEIGFREQALVVCDGAALVIADLHLGYTVRLEASNPREEYDTVVGRVGSLVRGYGPEVVVIAGDVFHEFAYPPAGAIEAVRRIRGVVHDHDVALVVTRGNHDTAAVPWRSLADEVTREYAPCPSALVLHGHEAPDGSAEYYITGHLHPFLEIESYDWPCFLYGEGVYHGSDVVILPAFNPGVGGVAVRPSYEPATTYPILTEGAGLGAYRPVVWDDARGEARTFPSLDDLEAI